MSAGKKKITASLLKLSAVMLAVSAGAKFVAGYVVRGWNRVQEHRHFSVDVVAPKYGPALVVSTDDYDDDPLGQIFKDGFHTQLFRKLAWLETLRKISVLVSLAGVVVTFILWLFSTDE